MRIALLAHHVAPIAPPFVGGVESHTWYLARWLADAGHDVTLFALAGSSVPGVELRTLPMRDVLISAQARKDVSALPLPFLAAHHAYLAVMLELERHCPFDAVHVNTLHYMPVAMAHTLPVRPLLTLHCPPTPWLESALALASARGPLPLDVVAVSSSLARSWDHVVREPAVIGNGVDLDTWRPGPGGEWAVWAGRMVPEKAPHVAIDAARAANVRLRLAGPIIDRAYWDEEVAPRLGTDVVYVGHLAHADLVDLFGRSRVAVQSPAWDEPFGLTAAEAAACGTPVAGFRRGGLPDAIGPASGVLTDGRDVDALADAICAAQQLDRTLVREDAELRLGIDAMGRRYEARYAELMHASPDSAPAPSLAARWPAPGIGGGRRVDRSTAA